MNDQHGCGQHIVFLHVLTKELLQTNYQMCWFISRERVLTHPCDDQRSAVHLPSLSLWHSTHCSEHTNEYIFTRDSPILENNVTSWTVPDLNHFSSDKGCMQACCQTWRLVHSFRGLCKQHTVYQQPSAGERNCYNLQEFSTNAEHKTFYCHVLTFWCSQQ